MCPRELAQCMLTIALTVQCPSYASEWAAAPGHSCPSSRPARFRRQACCCQPRKDIKLSVRVAGECALRPPYSACAQCCSPQAGARSRAHATTWNTDSGRQQQRRCAHAARPWDPRRHCASSPRGHRKGEDGLCSVTNCRWNSVRRLPGVQAGGDPWRRLASHEEQARYPPLSVLRARLQ